MRAALARGSGELGIALENHQIEKLLAFVELLNRWNRVYNLTRVTGDAQIVAHHLLDSLSIAPWMEGSTALDVGSGGGLPGIPLAIRLPEIHFTLLDSNGKKTRFLEQARIELGLANVRVVQSRIEGFEDAFDRVLCRAFAPLADIARLTAHLLTENGAVLAMKGHIEAFEMARDISPLCIDRVVQLCVPGIESERQLVILKKKKPGSA